MSTPVKTIANLPTAEQSLKIAQAFNPRQTFYKAGHKTELPPVTDKSVWNPDDGEEVTPQAREAERAKPFAIFRVKLLGLQPSECQREGMHAKCGGTIYSTPQSGLGKYVECMKCGAWHVKGGARRALKKN